MLSYLQQIKACLQHRTESFLAERTVHQPAELAVASRRAWKDPFQHLRIPPSGHMLARELAGNVHSSWGLQRQQQIVCVFTQAL